VNGFRNIYVSGGTDLLKNIFKLMKNGEGYGVDIKYLDDNNTNGSAKAMERAKQFVGSTTLFVPGDCVMDIDLKDMLRFHIANNGVASIAISSSEKSIPSSNDSILLKGNKVVCYGCNGQQGTHKLVATSVLIVEKDVFKYIPPGDMKWEINSDLLPLLANEGELFGYVYHGAWVSIKTREELEKAKSMLPLK
jgi:NDP-sugar pyrophosphorylase family protein